MISVEWEDSVLSHQGWEPIADVIDRQARDRVISTTVGIVLADDDRGVVIASSIHGNEAAGIVTIPKSAIRKRKRLR